MGLEDIRAVRLEKRQKIQSKGVNPYPVVSSRTHTVQEGLEHFDELTSEEKEVVLAGRIRALREHGSLTFGEVEDATGRMQIVLKRDLLGEVLYTDTVSTIDIGDFVSVKGVLFVTQRGERSLNVRDVRVLAKSLRSLPEKWSGFTNKEERYRKRYLDILINQDVRDMFRVRHTVVREIRDFYHTEGFYEVETPMLQILAGGASARPFFSHFNAFDMDVSLRIAPELYLKRLLVGGYEKVFEIGRNFRNEGVDYSHNPEFTMLESYCAYSDYKEGMKFVEDLVRSVVQGVVGGLVYERDGHRIDFGAPWERIELNDLLMKYASVDYEAYNFEGLKEKAESLGVKIEKKVHSKAEVADMIYKKHCRDHLIQPTFVIHHPREMLPLAKPLEKKPHLVGSIQLVVGGWEMAKGYSEMNDPVLQKQAFLEQEGLRQQGDDEAQSIDHDFIEALEYGMPPAFGLGVGVDRFAAFLAGASSLREIILFPIMKPKM